MRVTLRPATLADRRLIYEAAARSDVTDVLLGHPSHGHTPVLSYEAFCADYVQHYYDDSAPLAGRCYVIEVDGEAVGQVNYNAISVDHAGVRWVELDTWMFGERNCGRGYGTDALVRLCEHLRQQFDVRTFLLRPSASNARAVRCYEKAGFRKSALSDAELLRTFGPPDTIDPVHMTLTAGPGRSDPEGGAPC